MKQPLIAPSFLSANFLNLESEIKKYNQSNADWFHLDIMDGRFVPNITFGFPIIKQIKTIAQKPLDVHLMIVEPDKYIEKFAESGADILTVHYEACTHLNRTLSKIKSLGMKAGVSLNPHTPVHLLEDIIEYTDLVLIMSVNPGFGGQKFITQTLKKITKLREMIDKAENKPLIEVDGGVNTKNAKDLAEAGVDVLVAGSAIFKAEDPLLIIDKMKNLISD